MTGTEKVKYDNYSSGPKPRIKCDTDDIAGSEPLLEKWRVANRFLRNSLLPELKRTNIKIQTNS